MEYSSGSKPKSFFQRWAVTTLGVLVAANIINGIRYDTFAGLLIASLLLGVFNAILRPVMMLLSLPLLIATLGLFTLVINALLLYWVGWLVRPFHVDSFWAAFWGGLVVSIVSFAANLFIKGGERPAPPPRRDGANPPPPDRNAPGSGPIIDV